MQRLTFGQSFQVTSHAKTIPLLLDNAYGKENAKLKKEAYFLSERNLVTLSRTESLGFSSPFVDGPSTLNDLPNSS